MRLTLTFVALVGAFSTATAFLTARQSVPSCADSCMEHADFGSCSSGDNHCLCNNQAFVANVTACVEASCTGADLTNAEAFSQAVCKAVGVTLTSSATASGTTASSAGTAKGAIATTSTGGAHGTHANFFAGTAVVGFGILALFL